METSLWDIAPGIGWIIILVGVALLLPFAIGAVRRRNTTSVEVANRGVAIGRDNDGIAVSGDVGGDITQNQAQHHERSSEGQPSKFSLSDRITKWLGVLGAAIAVVGSAIELFTRLT